MWYLQDKDSGALRSCNLSSVPFTAWNWRMEWNITGSGYYSIYSTQSVIWTLSLCVTAPFKPMRTTNSKEEESPPPHESCQSTWLTLFQHTTAPLLHRERCHRGRESVGHWQREKRVKEYDAGLNAQEDKRRKTQSPWMSHAAHLSTSYWDIFTAQCALPLLLRLVRHHDTRPHTQSECHPVKEMSWWADTVTNWIKTAFNLISRPSELACDWIERVPLTTAAVAGCSEDVRHPETEERGQMVKIG